MATKRIKVAAAQLVTAGNIVSNLKKIVAAIRAAHRHKCRIVLFHEGALSEYPPESSLKQLDFEELARAERRVQRLAGRLGIAVLLGTIGRSGRRIYNDVMIVDEKGALLGRYAKTWRAGESWYSAMRPGHFYCLQCQCDRDHLSRSAAP